jgi:hypothetical protein
MPLESDPLTEGITKYHFMAKFLSVHNKCTCINKKTRLPKDKFCQISENVCDDLKSYPKNHRKSECREEI